MVGETCINDLYKSRVEVAMETVILAAGEGSRLESEETSDLPKSFLEIGDKTILEHQIETLRPLMEQGRLSDSVTMVLGHGFESDHDGSKRDEYVHSISGVDWTTPVVENWDAMENAMSLWVALQHTSDDLLILNGDVLFDPSIPRDLLRSFDRDSRNRIGIIEGLQSDMTGVRYDRDGIVTDYGAIESHQHVGVFCLDRSNRDEAREILHRNRQEWFPIIFEELETRVVRFDSRRCHEINYPRQLERVRRRIEI